VLNQAEIDDLLHVVGERGLLINSRRPDAQERIGRDKANGQRSLIGLASVEGRTVELVLALGGSFPITLPKTYLRPWDALGFIPHVDHEDGFVCYAAKEGLFLDASRPLEIIEYSIRKTLQILAAGVTGSNQADFTDELEAYWNRLRSVLWYQSVLNPGDEVRAIVVAMKKRDHGIIANDTDELLAFHNAEQLPIRYEMLDALYIPLQRGTVIIPPRSGGPMWSAEELRTQVWPNLSSPNAARLESLVKRRRTKDTVVLSVPRPSRGLSLIAFRATGMRDRHVLSQSGSAETLTPIALERCDRSYLVPRGGGEPAFRNKRVMLLGLGAVGGRIGFELARAGVLELTLVDEDQFGPDNTFRHVLGRELWGRPKADAMKTAIKRDLPYVRVTTFHKSLQELLLADAPPVSLLDYDLVISATADQAAELALNRALRETSGAPPSIFTWLEPLGIGGHTMLMLRESAGCLECLYRDPDGSQRSHNRLSFTESDQEFGRALTGCGSLHMPFGSLDAARTAEMATRLAIDVLRGAECRRSLVRSWKGDSRDFTAAGFRLAPRFDFSEDVLQAQEKQFAVTSCPICGVTVQR
jgi:molybdopterin/thiamine biosynthesis adenylyltransferase